MTPDTPATGTPADRATGTPADPAEHSPSCVPLLDARQRAMLAEMGVRVWAPKPVESAVAPAAFSPDTRAIPAPVSVPGHVPVPAPAPVARPALAPRSRAVADPDPVPTAPVLSAVAEGVDAMDWDQLRETVAGCQACGLCEGRTQAVFGVGAAPADWMIVGDSPGATEDLQGEPYLGEAGQMLDSMLRAVGRSRSAQGAEAAYLTHVTRCRPATQRNPQPAEIAQCAPYLARQVALVGPRVILAMGPLAAQALLQSQEPIGKLRGRVHRFQGIPVVVTFPPSHLLRTPANKGKAWADLCLALEQTLGQRPAA
jgi:uracil-DNA glycosylase family 4